MTVSPDGSDVRELANVPGRESRHKSDHPLTWSPDGSALLASSTYARVVTGRRRQSSSQATVRDPGRSTSAQA